MLCRSSWVEEDEEVRSLGGPEKGQPRAKGEAAAAA
jgi:hypothetical protein